MSDPNPQVPQRMNLKLVLSPLNVNGTKGAKGRTEQISTGLALSISLAPGIAYMLDSFFSYQ